MKVLLRLRTVLQYFVVWVATINTLYLIAEEADNSGGPKIYSGHVLPIPFIVLVGAVLLLLYAMIADMIFSHFCGDKASCSEEEDDGKETRRESVSEKKLHFTEMDWGALPVRDILWGATILFSVLGLLWIVWEAYPPELAFPGPGDRIRGPNTEYQHRPRRDGPGGRRKGRVQPGQTQRPL